MATTTRFFIIFVLKKVFNPLIFWLKKGGQKNNPKPNSIGQVKYYSMKHNISKLRKIKLHTIFLCKFYGKLTTKGKKNLKVNRKKGSNVSAVVIERASRCAKKPSSKSRKTNTLRRTLVIKSFNVDSIIDNVYYMKERHNSR